MVSHLCGHSCARTSNSRRWWTAYTQNACIRLNAGPCCCARRRHRAGAFRRTPNGGWVKGASRSLEARRSLPGRGQERGDPVQPVWPRPLLDMPAYSVELPRRQAGRTSTTTRTNWRWRWRADRLIIGPGLMPLAAGAAAELGFDDDIPRRARTAPGPLTCPRATMPPACPARAQLRGLRAGRLDRPAVPARAFVQVQRAHAPRAPISLGRWDPNARRRR